MKVLFLNGGAQLQKVQLHGASIFQWGQLGGGVQLQKEGAQLQLQAVLRIYWNRKIATDRRSHVNL